MLYTIITTSNARRDIQIAIDWENMRKRGLAKRFFEDLEQKLLAIADTPYLGSVRYKNARCVATNISPILYIIL
jgi:plasmid stabilization system protein ParE